MPPPGSPVPLPAGPAGRGLPGGTGRLTGGPPPAVGAPSAAAIAKLKRAEARRQIQVAQQLKVATLVVVALLLLAAFPTYQWIRSEAKDPVFGQLDALGLPAWAVGTVSDASDGSRWCIGRCRFRERTWASERAPEETQTAYIDGAARSGLAAPNDRGLPECPGGSGLVLEAGRVRAGHVDPHTDLRPAATAADDFGRAVAGRVDPGGSGGPVATCPGALVTVKVFNAIGYHTTP